VIATLLVLAGLRIVFQSHSCNREVNAGATRW
jgi:hypothetical protein